MIKKGIGITLGVNNIDQRRIRLMTKLAVYDKNMGESDKEMSGYTWLDFMYRRNFWTRLSVLFGLLIVGAVYFLNKIVILGMDLFSFDYKAELTSFAYFAILVLLIYSVIGGVVASIEYRKMQHRLKKYFHIMDLLEKGNNTNEK